MTMLIDDDDDGDDDADGDVHDVLMIKMMMIIRWWWYNICISGNGALQSRTKNPLCCWATWDPWSNEVDQ